MSPVIRPQIRSTGGGVGGVAGEPEHGHARAIRIGVGQPLEECHDVGGELAVVVGSVEGAGHRVERPE
jgi:hypothetical protein